MTTVITRLYQDHQTAATVVSALKEAGFPDNTIDMLSAGDSDLAGAMEAARIPADAAETYAGEVSGDVTLVVIRAPFTPFGAARKAIDIVDATASAPSAVTDNNTLVSENIRRELTLSVMTSHRLFLTDTKEMSRNNGRISTGFGWRMLSRRKTKTSAISGGRFMSRAFWPMSLLSNKKSKLSVYRGGKKFLTS